MSIEYGGPAFPAPYGVTHVTTQGMTLHQWYAGLAMQGLLANSNCDHCPLDNDSFADIAVDAHLLADKMIAVGRGALDEEEIVDT